MKKTYMTPAVKALNMHEEELMDQWSNPGGTVDGSEILGKENNPFGDDTPKQKSVWDD